MKYLLVIIFFQLIFMQTNKILPAQIDVNLPFFLFIFLIISATFLVWPCAVSTTIKSIFSLLKLDWMVCSLFLNFDGATFNCFFSDFKETYFFVLGLKKLNSTGSK